MFWALLATLSAEPPFPERIPSMIENCIHAALESRTLSKEDGSHKYICGGQVAEEFWDYLEKKHVEASDQTTDNGIWSSRYFPLGGCFKRVRNLDGTSATGGLSCTIWIPYRIDKKADD